ncbi:hypothetical protein A2U01_0021812, partial [Trifolium medium]|nr:hypothetical protein [Trifolium medium]
MDIGDLINREGDNDALKDYLQRMRTITNEERLAFLAKARQQKSEPETVVGDPLTQLLVEDEASKGGKRKRKTETGRITMPIPNKGEASTTGSGVEGTTQLRGGSGDKNKTDVAARLGVAQPSSSHTAPVTDFGAAPSLWDPLFNPMEFIENEINMVGDISRFSAASTEELRKKSLGYELKGLLLNYLLSSRQEQEVLEAKNKMKVVDENLDSIEK